jgi:hypothetical protein
MDLFVQETVFNRNLVGKAVTLKGRDVDCDEWEGLYLVKAVKFTNIVLIDKNGEDYNLHMENFGGDYLTLTIIG